MLTLRADEMLRRFLQHVPPRGMHRVRAFGLLHPAERHSLRRLQLLLGPRSPMKPERDVEPTTPTSRAATKCAHCGEPGLALIRRLLPDLALRAELAAALPWPRARAPPPLEPPSTPPAR